MTANTTTNLEDKELEAWLDRYVTEWRTRTITDAPYQLLPKYRLGWLRGRTTIFGFFQHIKYVVSRYNDAELISLAVEMRMDGVVHNSFIARAVEFILFQRNLTVPDQNGYPTSVQAPDPVDPGVPG